MYNRRQCAIETDERVTFSLSVLLNNFMLPIYEREAKLHVDDALLDISSQ